MAVAASTAAAMAVGSLLALAVPTKTQTQSLVERVTIRVKSWILRASGVERQFIVLLPPEPPVDTTRNGSPSSNSLRHQEENPFHLLIIFPAAHVPPKDYVAIGRLLQHQAIRSNKNFRVVVGIGVDPYQYHGLLVPWATNGNDPSVWANWIQQKAEVTVTGIPRKRVGTPRLPPMLPIRKG